LSDPAVGGRGGGAHGAGRSLVRNIGFNFVGQATPLLVALVAIPLLIAGMGTDRFGVLALVWMLVGYFSLFDLGLGRALTQAAAARIGAGREDEVPAVAAAALLLMLVLGVAGAGVLYLGAPWLVARVLTVPAEIHAETVRAFSLLALSLPIIITTAGLRGLLEAKQRFGIVNAIRVPLGAFFFLGPLLVLPFSTSLVPVVAVTIGGRVVAWVVHLIYCLRLVPGLGSQVRVRRETVVELLSFGGWMTLSNVISPLMVYLDRFLVGGVVSMAAVAYYVTPYEVVTKLWVVPTAVLGVLFPAFASSYVSDRRAALVLAERARKVLFITLFPCILLLVGFASEGLAVWLGPEFAENSTFVLQWLAIGVFVNSLSSVPFTVLQSAGRADWIARLHLLELPFYLLLVWWLIGAYGIQGAAAAWVLRIAVDALLMSALVERVLPGSRRVNLRTLVQVVPALSVLAWATSFQHTPGFKAGVLLAGCVVFLVLAWLAVLDGTDRAAVIRTLRPERTDRGSDATAGSMPVFRPVDEPAVPVARARAAEPVRPNQP
jgi:O-antigen/teichoic acid export membrane protein